MTNLIQIEIAGGLTAAKVAHLVDLKAYDIILINTSAGKDSLAMLDYVVRLAKEQGVLDRVVAVHCDLGERVEWAGTKDLAQRQCDRYGVKMHVVSRKQGDLLAHVEERGRWMAPKIARYCTSDHKRQQVLSLVTKLVTKFVATQPWGSLRKKYHEQVRVLNCMGLRAQESDERAAMAALKPGLNPATGKYERGSSSVRVIDTWLPIHSWSTEDVWRHIHAEGLESHPAYGLGMPRLSCAFCFYAGKDALLLAGYHNRAMLREYVAVEAKIGHTFKQGLGLAEVQAELEAGWVPSGAAADWDDQACA